MKLTTLWIAGMMLASTAGQVQAGFITFDETSALLPWGGGSFAEGLGIPTINYTRGIQTRKGNL
jgi:hypothetical protein